MENNTGAMSILDAVQESHPDVAQSTEQQEDATTQETTEDSTEESTEETTSETQVDDDATEQETETTEEETSETESDIFDLNTEDEQTNESENQEETSEETSLNFGEILNGEFENEEDLAGYIGELQSEIDELKSKSPTFANEYVEKMNQYVLNGGKASDFARVQGLSFDAMNPVEILATEIMWKNPDISKDDAENYIMNKYESALDEDGNVNHNDVSLKLAAADAKKTLSEIQAKDSLVEDGGRLTQEQWLEKQETESQTQEELRVKQDTERMMTWMKPVEDSINELKEKGLTVALSDSKGFKFAFDGDEKYTEDLISRVDKALYAQGTSYNENPELGKQMVETIFKMDNFDKITKAIATKVSNTKNKEHFEKTHNPSALHKGDKPSTTTEEASPEETMTRLWSQ